MELDRSHFRNTSSTTSELFICFTSRLSSSSSMKLTKSIISPGRAARDGGPTSISSSLSRRLRTNGNLTGGASPFTTKKRGCGFENPEPSSPKVTCIGQVRVKTKKKVRQQTRSLSKRRSGEVSFRNIEHSHNKSQNQECFPQRLGHLPVSICEGLKAISCFFAAEKVKGEEKGDENGNGCGAVFTRWLVSVNDDGESGKRREIELVVGGGDDEVEEKRVSFSRSSRRHVFDDFEVMDDRIEFKGQSFDVVRNCKEEEEMNRMSVCVPPKNALLLMRCRSDPMKVAALASRFSWDARAAAPDDNRENEGDVEEMEGVCDGNKQVFVSECERENEIFVVEEEFEHGGDASVECNKEEVESIEMEDDGNEELYKGLVVENMVEDERYELHREIGEVNEDKTLVEDEAGEEVESNMSSVEDILDQDNADQHYEDCPIQKDERVITESPICELSPSTESELEQDIDSNESESVCPIPEEAPLAKSKNGATIDVEFQLQPVIEEPKPNKARENQELKFLNEEPQKENESLQALPDCLLLMMCEPKLSMEVSKETWVCGKDFIRWLPERPPKQQQTKATKAAASCNYELPKRCLSTDPKPKHLEEMINILHQPATNKVQPPRSSCSLPPKAPSMASMIEQKLVNAVAYEPFVLTRCNSEPMRTAASKLMPDSFYWKNAMRKLEPHRRATVGAAAGVGC